MARQSVTRSLYFDWNGPGGGLARPRVTVVDETLREGLQSPSAREPRQSDKVELLHRMSLLGIRAATLGMPSASPRALADVCRLSAEVPKLPSPLAVGCAARTVESDIDAVAEVGQRSGVGVTAYLFLGASLPRRRAENWGDDFVLGHTERAVAYSKKLGLGVCYVNEDSTRSDPRYLSRVIRVALDHGAERICVSDTVGYATPDGVASVLRFVRHVATNAGHIGLELEWHGHNDRGLAVANALAAIDAGVGRIHTTALGLGERTGNVPTEVLLANLDLLGMAGEYRVERLGEYCDAAAKAFDYSVPESWPVVGRDAFRTTAGVHAAAIRKANLSGGSELADAVYSSLPAARFGRKQEIALGPQSGKANVKAWLEEHEVTVDDSLVRHILSRAKASGKTLTDDEVYAGIAEWSCRTRTVDVAQ